VKEKEAGLVRTVAMARCPGFDLEDSFLIFFGAIFMV